MSMRRFGGGAWAAAGLIGTRIAAGPASAERAPVSDRVPPDWLAELDQHEGCEELFVSLYCELGEVLETRIAGRPPEAPAIARCCAHERRVGRRGERRARCQTRP